MTQIPTTSLIVRVDPENPKSYIKIRETLENVQEMFIEHTSKALFQDTPENCKDFAEMCRYEASKHLTIIFGMGWRAAGNVLSYMSKGDMLSAERTVKRCLL
ncbi:MAG: hypothetical protein EOL88_08110 [Bacteroidia bacterium]|nr:hypothetical protein [Bacteroidia bacterium]